MIKEKIRISEVRIGNYLLFDYSSLPQFVENRESQLIEDDLKIWIEKDYWDCDVSGISLTEDWLSKLGIQNTKTIPVSYRGKYLQFIFCGLLCYFFFDKQTIEFAGRSEEYNFVHEIQNLYFGLHKKEIEIA